MMNRRWAPRGEPMLRPYAFFFWVFFLDLQSSPPSSPVSLPIEPMHLAWAFLMTVYGLSVCIWCGVVCV